MPYSIANAMTILWIMTIIAVACGNGQIVSYTLTYSSVDCSGTAGWFQARNESTCTPAACSRFGGGSRQGFCHIGTLESLANPVACSGCAYCGYVNYPGGVNCDPNSWGTSSVERLGVCVNAGPGSFIGYACTLSGIVVNYTQYSDVGCTMPTVVEPPGPSTCIAGQPVCTNPQVPVQEGFCSYSNLFDGGGQNGTHGIASKRALSSMLFLLTLIWVTL